MTLSEILSVVFCALVMAAASFGVAALIYLPPVGERCFHVATKTSLTAWLFVGMNRLRWTVGFGSLTHLWSAVQLHTWTVSTSLFMAVGGTLGVAVACRRDRLLGHTLLALVAMNFILWEVFEMQMLWIAEVLAKVPDKGLAVLQDAEIQLLVLSVVTIALSGVHISRALRPRANELARPSGAKS